MRAVLIAGLLIFCYTTAGYSRVTSVSDTRGLQKAIDRAKDNDTLLLEPTTFVATPQPFTDSLCGNCLDPRTLATASTGFVIQKKSLTILGKNREKTILQTGAGYGLYIENCPIVFISNLTITGGVRDLDGNATDAGIVVRTSSVRLTKLTVSDNIKRDTAVVVGIGGIFGREGTELVIDDCVIKNNTWDGVALYRGATATISDCTIEKGRGAGIGVTWDATCHAYRNRVSGFWKGIGSFGSSIVIARNNVVKDNLGWGMIASGTSYMEMANNVVYNNGNCGIAPWGTEARGKIINNIVMANGWREQWVCPCVGVWNYGDWSAWVFANNIVFGNKDGQYRDIWDQSEVNGNLSVDPLFVDTVAFDLQTASPALHTGDSTVYNLDGTRSHVGRTGGPQALPKW